MAGTRRDSLQHLVNVEAGSAGEWEIEVAIRFQADGHDYEMRRRATSIGSSPHLNGQNSSMSRSTFGEMGLP